MGNQALSVLFPFVYLPYLGFSSTEKYEHPNDRKPFKKSTTREWTDAIIFAVVAATIIRTFLIEAYTIPTSSMEKSLLVGDFLFVNKFAYGSRVPNTPLSVPFTHHSFPRTTKQSFSDAIQLDYKRYNGYADIKNDDVVVFNFPEGDTVVVGLENPSYYTQVRQVGRDYVYNNFKVITRPVDKRENYIKRCVGIPGDTIEIVHNDLFINGKPENDKELKQYTYFVKTNGEMINKRVFKRLNISEEDRDMRYFNGVDTYILPLTEENVEKLRSFNFIQSVTKAESLPGNNENLEIFPHHPSFGWSRDNFGPLVVPQKGSTVELSINNLPIYERVIGLYENNKLEVIDSTIYINGEVADSYTFKMDYYWMMGDNRHKSQDSRYWGFVPEDHVVGKAVFVWMSWEKDDSAVRWNKLFRFIK